MLSSYRDPETGLIHTPVICDVCLQRIDDVAAGATILSDQEPGRSPPQPLRHAHKGACLDEIERNEQGALLWNELIDLTSDLMEGLGLNLVDVADRELAWLGDGDAHQQDGVHQQVAEVGEKLQTDSRHSPLSGDQVPTTGS
jgi:hypothetical protein